MRILIAEDSRVQRLVLEETLTRWGHDVVAVCDGEEAWQALSAEGAPQLAILDWMMPMMDGVEVCRKVRQQNREPYIYILLLTARDQKADVVQGIQAGADDYIAKPFDPQELEVRLISGRRIINLQGELIAAREALRVQATHDPLTGVWNRTAIMDALRRELARGSRESQPVAVVMADLDHFKRVNDTYGHMVGDAVLCETVKRMQRCVRPYDGLGRYGGEEFLILLTHNSAARAELVAQRICACISHETFDTSEGAITVTVSLGVAATDQTPAVDVDSLVQAADAALYRAKASGRNRVEMAAGDDRIRASSS